MRIIKCHSGRSRAHLAVSTEQVSFQTSEGAVVKIDFTFHYGPLWQPVRLSDHVALIAIPRAQLITSFLPSLVSCNESITESFHGLNFRG